MGDREKASLNKALMHIFHIFLAKITDHSLLLAVRE